MSRAQRTADDDEAKEASPGKMMVLRATPRRPRRELAVQRIQPAQIQVAVAAGTAVEFRLSRPLSVDIVVWAAGRKKDTWPNVWS
jgi:hypothetical protein